MLIEKPYTTYAAVVTEHRRLGHELMETFGQADCRTCEWRAYLTFTGGNPFNPDSRDTIWHTTVNGQKVSK